MKKRLLISIAIALFMSVAIMLLPGVGTMEAKAWNDEGAGTKENPWKVGNRPAEKVIAYFDSDTGTLYIEGDVNETMQHDYYTGYSYRYAFDSIRNKVKSINISGVTSIYSSSTKGTFQDMINLEEVMITTDSDYLYCDEYTFSGCTKLKTINMNQGKVKLSKIEAGVFYNCESLSSDIEIIGNNGYINEFAFANCKNMTKIVIPDNVTKIGVSAFKGCSNLKEVSLPESVCTIDESAFRDCASLEKLVIPNTKYTINSHAFEGCTSLKEVRLSEKSTTINGYVFKDCVSLEKILIPNTYTSVADYAFQNCTNLKEVTIGNGVKTIGDYAFYNCKAIEIVSFPTGLNTIGTYAFGEDNKITEINLSNSLSLTKIGDNAFYNCSSINKIKLPQGANMSIGSSAFRYATSLKSITFPSNITSIGMYAFSNRNNLTSITFEGTDTIMSDYALGSGIEANFNVPIGSEETYKDRLLEAGIIRSDGNSIINNHQHMFDQEIANEAFLKTNATCTQAAVYYKSCGCGEYDSTQTFVYGTALPHDWDEGKMILESTEDMEGVMFFYCQRTGCHETKTEKIDKKEHVHNFSIQKVDKQYLKSAANCVSAAVYFKSCKCGQASSSDVFTSGSKTNTHTWDKGTVTKKATTKAEGVKTYKCTVAGCTASKTEAIPKLKETDTKPTEPNKPSEPGKVELFVRRIYTDCLGRNPEEDGVKYWSAELINGNKDGASVGAGFVFSEEYMRKGSSKQDYVKMLYKVFMGREADEGGLKYWLDSMNNGMTREEVFKGFVDSKEYTQICSDYGIIRGDYTIQGIPDPTVTNGTVTKAMTDFVERIYVKALNRDSDPEGIKYWAQEIANESKSPVEVAELFIFSEEFESKKLDDTEYVKVLYRTFMGREFDEAGLNYWLGQIAAGQTRKDVLEAFAGCQEFQDIVKSFGL